MDNIDEKIWCDYKKTKSPEIKEMIIKEYVHLIKLVAGRMNIHINSQIDYDDVLGYGIFGLIDAIDKYDYEKGIKFETYASLRIRGEIIDNIRKIDWIPRSLRQKSKILDSVVSKFEQDNGREPSTEEVAKILDITPKEAEVLIKNSSVYNLISLDDYLENTHEKSNRNLVCNSIKTPEQELETKEIQKSLADLIDKLNDNQKKVITLYYFEELTLKEISRILGVSESRVSQIHSKTIRQLKTKLGGKAEFFY